MPGDRHMSHAAASPPCSSPPPRSSPPPPSRKSSFPSSAFPSRAPLFRLRAASLRLALVLQVELARPRRLVVPPAPSLRERVRGERAHAPQGPRAALAGDEEKGVEIRIRVVRVVDVSGDFGRSADVFGSVSGRFSSEYQARTLGGDGGRVGALGDSDGVSASRARARQVRVLRASRIHRLGDDEDEDARAEGGALDAGRGELRGALRGRQGASQEHRAERREVRAAVRRAEAAVLDEELARERQRVPRAIGVQARELHHHARAPVVHRRERHARAEGRGGRGRGGGRGGGGDRGEVRRRRALHRARHRVRPGGSRASPAVAPAAARAVPRRAVAEVGDALRQHQRFHPRGIAHRRVVIASRRGAGGPASERRTASKEMRGRAPGGAAEVVVRRARSSMIHRTTFARRCFQPAAPGFGPLIKRSIGGVLPSRPISGTRRAPDSSPPPARASGSVGDGARCRAGAVRGGHPPPRARPRAAARPSPGARLSSTPPGCRR